MMDVKKINKKGKVVEEKATDHMSTEILGDIFHAKGPHHEAAVMRVYATKPRLQLSAVRLEPADEMDESTRSFLVPRSPF